MTPFFSIIIPTLNRRVKLRRALDSVVAQTDGDFDVWVIDDGDDGTEAMLHGFDARVNYLRGSGTGVAGARNAGIRASAGTFVAFLDADDRWHADKLQRIRDAIRRHPDAGLFYSQLVYVDSDGRALWTPHVTAIHGNGYVPVIEANFLSNSATVVSRESLAAVGGFDEALTGCEDWDLWIRIARICQMHLVPEVLVSYEHLSEGSITSRYGTWLKSIDEVIAKTFAEDTELSAQARRRIRSGVACAKGRIAMGDRDDARARQEFRAAVRARPLNWRALTYLTVLSFPYLRAVLPPSAKVALRLPEARRTGGALS